MCTKVFILLNMIIFSNHFITSQNAWHTHVIGVRGLASWSWRILTISSCQVTNSDSDKLHEMTKFLVFNSWEAEHYLLSQLVLKTVHSREHSCTFLHLRGSGGLTISSYQWTNLSVFYFQDVNLAYRRGSGGLPPEAEEFWQFQVTSRPVSDFSGFKIWIILFLHGNQRVLFRKISVFWEDFQVIIFLRVVFILRVLGRFSSQPFQKFIFRKVFSN